MSHDCRQLQGRLDRWPVLAAEERARLDAEAAGCAACGDRLAAARQLTEVLQSGRRQHLALRYGGPRPDFAAAPPPLVAPRWRRPTGKRLLPLAAVLLVALGLRWVWLAGGSPDGERRPPATAAKAVGGTPVLALPPAPRRPTAPTRSALSVGQLRRPTPPDGSRSLTFTSPPRPSVSTAEAAGERTATDARQGERS